jgi:DNA-binding SARP family transcriptional activator
VVVRLHPSAFVKPRQVSNSDEEVHHVEPGPHSACCRCRPCAITREFRILGPLEVVDADRVRPLGGKLLRGLILALLLHACELRTPDQLIDDLWGDCPPATARASLHNLVSTLRRTLGRDVLETTHSGYVLAVTEDRVDAFRFERLLDRARGACVVEKVRLLDQALGLWRGSPLVDVRYEEFAQGEIRRLEELRVDALEELLAAKLELGAGAALVPELERLVDGFPLREQLRMQLMVALHRSGRSVEALGSYVDWRRTLIDAWGIEPGCAIRQVWDDIRLQTSELEVVH